ncbi:o-succinylbenzoate synthase [Wenyingzhuangia marina]|uniref:O-succinylbenzoate synthase n=1 Tax=Wenyingzhuangia marina TaxID=1195760 RepID=A0A1M5WNK4_9FLAO|nr:o-succinylbenzoate synthase [Wenyingzhuangia marina]GGF79534.1 o-succinylbenzoate synthase [Wenyingzhuangia marina]SHH89089.1 o-succinylbenzoate synthase [Wenyingzhuangia marina]
MKANYKKYILDFKQASGTSRGILKTKETYFIILEKDGKIGYGETGVFRGLSADDRPDYEANLKWACQNIHLGIDVLWKELIEFPSIQFGLEQAFLSLESSNGFDLFPSEFTNGEDVIPINGLIWMGSEAFMKEQVADKIKAGFSTIKMKIGAIDFDTEIKLLSSIRERFTPKEITLRVDANGAFDPQNALRKLERLAMLGIHSIEQPIKQGELNAMRDLCSKSPVPVALDEELIGVFKYEEKVALLKNIHPQYIILKPSLVGGFRGCNEWIEIANSLNIPYWITSALESNIGLNAISQYTYTLGVTMPQGLGTGSLFTNNIESPLEVVNGNIKYNKDKAWKIDF